jgi:hypothetical protein
MATLPSVKSIRREDLGNDIPEWVSFLLAPLTTFMEAIYSALNKQFTFQENIACNLRQLTFTTSSGYTGGAFTALIFPSNLRGRKPIGVLILQITESTGLLITKAVSPSWVDISGTISVNYIAGLENSKQYEVLFLVV